MSKTKKRRYQSRRSTAVELALPHGRRPRREKEDIPDLWEVGGNKLPGNPRYTKHEPEFTYITDAQGERVCVIESRIMKFKASSAGINELRKLRRVQSADRLWQGPWYVIMTHALRLLLACSMARADEQQSGLHGVRRLRDGITPTQLLHETGLQPTPTDEVMAELARLELLIRRKNGHRVCWYVSDTFRGFGPGGKLYMARELIDGWALPEFDPSAPNYSTEQRSNGMPAPPLKEPEQRIRVFNLTYQALKTLVPTDAVIANSIASFETRYALAEKVNELVPELSLRQIQRALQELKILEVIGWDRAGRELYNRWLKLDITGFTEQDVEFVRAVRRGEPSTPPAPVSPPPPAPPEGGNPLLSPEQASQILLKLGQKLERVQAELQAEREAHNATRVELEALQSRQIQVAAPDPEWLAKLLED